MAALLKPLFLQMVCEGELLFSMSQEDREDSRTVPTLTLFKYV